MQSAARWGVDGLLLLLTACAPSSLIKLKVAAGVTALSSLQRRNHAAALAPHPQGCAARPLRSGRRGWTRARLHLLQTSALRPGGEDEGLLAPPAAGLQQKSSRLKVPVG